ncbi:serpin family protein [bacterium]|nr:serpin family protein [bacterium]
MTSVSSIVRTAAVLAAAGLIMVSGGACNATSSGEEQSSQAGAVPDAGGRGESGADADEVRALAVGGNEFGFDPYSHLKGAGNLFFSPYSLSAALTMTWTGARGNTAAEMAAVLRLSLEDTGMHTRLARDAVAAASGALEQSLLASPDERGYELRVANALWGLDGYRFLDEFTQRLDAHYGAGMNRVDFIGDAEGARVTINEWAEDRTNGRIEELVPAGSLNAATVLLLTNAIYFKGTWADQFSEESTYDATFHGTSGDSEVSMMTRKGDFGYFENDDMQVLEMPYEGGDLSMLVVLPREGLLGGLARIEGGLATERLDSWVSGLRSREVTVHMPKFEMTWGTVDVARDLYALGMRDAFGGGDFSGMDGTQDLFISYVFHKAFISVNEEGSEAAAATAVVMERCAAPGGPEFRVDRPFMFLIRDNASGAILFMGRVVELDE